MGTGVLPQKQKPGENAEKILRQRTGGAGTSAKIIGLTQFPFVVAAEAFSSGFLAAAEAQEQAKDGNQEKSQNGKAPGETPLIP